jgi:hypothetical protein
MQHKHLLKKFFIFSFLFIAGVLIGVSLLIFIKNTFCIQNIEVFGASQEEQVVIVKLLKQRSVFTTQPPLIKKIIETRFSYIKVKKVQIVLPSTIVISVEKEKPLAYLQTDYGYLVLSKNGTILKKVRSKETPFPFLIFYQKPHHSEYQMGQKIGFSVIMRTLGFISLLADEGYRVETVAIDSVDMIACKTKGFEVAFSQTRPIELQQHEVRQIVRQIKAGALQIVRLDLRFDKPVVHLPQK